MGDRRYVRTRSNLSSPVPAPRKKCALHRRKNGCTVPHWVSTAPNAVESVALKAASIESFEFNVQHAVIPHIVGVSAWFGPS